MDILYAKLLNCERANIVAMSVVPTFWHSLLILWVSWGACSLLTHLSLTETRDYSLIYCMVLNKTIHLTDERIVFHCTERWLNMPWERLQYVNKGYAVLFFVRMAGGRGVTVMLNENHWEFSKGWINIFLLSKSNKLCWYWINAFVPQNIT